MLTGYETHEMTILFRECRAFREFRGEFRELAAYRTANTFARVSHGRNPPGTEHLVAEYLNGAARHSRKRASLNSKAVPLRE
jgi:hypothetical protein